MSIDARSRMVTFRLSEQEYERFRELCFVRGIRSVSEMARLAINMLSQQPARVPREALEMRVAELEGRIHLLALEVKKLNAAGGLNGFGSAGELELVTAKACD